MISSSYFLVLSWNNGFILNFSVRYPYFNPLLHYIFLAKFLLKRYLINSLDNLVQGGGTSYSSPIIAGSVACLLQAFPTLKNNQIMNIIRYTASQYQYPDYYLGYGIPNFELAYQLALNVEEAPIIIFPNPVDEILNIVSTIDGYLEIKIFDISGKLLYSSIINGMNNVLLMHNFQKGIYILEIKSEYDDLEIFKIVKH
mgnify:CR=1 FL=1